MQGRQPVSNPAGGPAATTTILTVRHGLTEGNAGQRISRQAEGLSEEGRAQAQEAVQALREVPYDVVISSPLARAVETARIATGLPPERILIEPLCTERSFGLIEGLSQAEVHVRFPEVRYRPVEGINYSLNPPQGERIEDLHERAHRFVEELLERYAGRRVLVFSHGNFLQQVHAVLRGLGPFEALACPPDEMRNCAFNEFVVAPDGALLSHRTQQLCSTADRYALY
jgi:broad specificity phosphatase PhoE